MLIQFGHFSNLTPYMTFDDPSPKFPGLSSGKPKSKMFSIHQGTPKHFQTFVPKTWSRDLKADPLLNVLPTVDHLRRWEKLLWI